MMGQLLCHLWGDYLLQSDWMAQNKTKQFNAAFIHATLYHLPFFLLVWSAPKPYIALQVILWSHFLIDRYRLARFVVYAKNWTPTLPENWREIGPAVWHRTITPTGYPAGTPDWLGVWLLIIADNTLHLTINYLALRYL